MALPSQPKYMAMYKYFAIFLSLVACHDSLSSVKVKDGVSSFEDLGDKAMSVATISAVASPRQVKRSTINFEGDAEAFRPTTPGHSPGIRHSINN
ncbi:hypothetical protein VNO77_25311 [Canavalia gladiata]|uniref:Uncharacterized protein n=1 Tax=Canavalia gladiata TaxID=3824 RepID=A0AAN9QDF1_CANGL